MIQQSTPAAREVQHSRAAALVTQQSTPAAKLIQSSTPAASIIRPSATPAADGSKQSKPVLKEIQQSKPAASLIPQSTTPAAKMIKHASPGADSSKQSKPASKVILQSVVPVAKLRKYSTSSNRNSPVRKQNNESSKQNKENTLEISEEELCENPQSTMPFTKMNHNFRTPPPKVNKSSIQINKSKKNAPSSCRKSPRRKQSDGLMKHNLETQDNTVEISGSDEDTDGTSLQFTELSTKVNLQSTRLAVEKESDQPYENQQHTSSSKYLTRHCSSAVGVIKPVAAVSQNASSPTQLLSSQLQNPQSSSSKLVQQTPSPMQEVTIKHTASHVKTITSASEMVHQSETPVASIAQCTPLFNQHGSPISKKVCESTPTLNIAERTRCSNQLTQSSAKFSQHLSSSFKKPETVGETIPQSSSVVQCTPSSTHQSTSTSGMVDQSSLTLSTASSTLPCNHQQSVPSVTKHSTSSVSSTCTLSRTTQPTSSHMQQIVGNSSSSSKGHTALSTYLAKRSTTSSASASKLVEYSVTPAPKLFQHTPPHHIQEIFNRMKLSGTSAPPKLHAKYDKTAPIQPSTRKRLEVDRVSFESTARNRFTSSDHMAVQSSGKTMVESEKNVKMPHIEPVVKLDNNKITFEFTVSNGTMATDQVNLRYKENNGKDTQRREPEIDKEPVMERDMDDEALQSKAKTDSKTSQYKTRNGQTTTKSEHQSDTVTLHHKPKGMKAAKSEKHMGNSEKDSRKKSDRYKRLATIQQDWSLCESSESERDSSFDKQCRSVGRENRSFESKQDSFSKPKRSIAEEQKPSDSETDASFNAQNSLAAKDQIDRNNNKTPKSVKPKEQGSVTKAMSAITLSSATKDPAKASVKHHNSGKSSREKKTIRSPVLVLTDILRTLKHTRPIVTSGTDSEEGATPPKLKMSERKEMSQIGKSKSTQRLSSPSSGHLPQTSKCTRPIKSNNSHSSSESSLSKLKLLDRGQAAKVCMSERDRVLESDWNFQPRKLKIAERKEKSQMRRQETERRHLSSSDDGFQSPELLSVERKQPTQMQRSKSEREQFLDTSQCDFAPPKPKIIEKVSQLKTAKSKHQQPSRNAEFQSLKLKIKESEETRQMRNVNSPKRHTPRTENGSPELTVMERRPSRLPQSKSKLSQSLDCTDKLLSPKPKLPRRKRTGEVEHSGSERVHTSDTDEEIRSSKLKFVEANGTSRRLKSKSQRSRVFQSDEFKSPTLDISKQPTGARKSKLVANKRMQTSKSNRTALFQSPKISHSEYSWLVNSDSDDTTYGDTTSETLDESRFSGKEDKAMSESKTFNSSSICLGKGNCRKSICFQCL